MPKGLRRYQSTGSDHFLTFSCYQRRPFLAGEGAYAAFEEELERLRERHVFQVYGYVLMPEHVHLLVSEPKLHPLATTINVLKNETSSRLKGARERFWQTRYFDFNVITWPKIVEKLRYMHRNPVKRGLVERPEDWPWSSYRHWLTGERGRVEIESNWTVERRLKEGGDPLSPNIVPPTRSR